MRLPRVGPMFFAGVLFGVWLATTEIPRGTQMIFCVFVGVLTALIDNAMGWRGDPPKEK